MLRNNLILNTFYSFKHTTMRYLKTTLLLLAIGVSVNVHAADYVIIQQTFWGQIRFVYVPQPKNLAKWYHDTDKDIYYRFKTWIGIPVMIVKPRYFTGHVNQNSQN
ncbi:MAG: hypothetical protein JWQ38_261 [Flavipsychrobacter sp.]|nr:hypothetical protein [Flavipsychrobacter sp.]